MKKIFYAIIAVTFLVLGMDKIEAKECKYIFKTKTINTELTFEIKSNGHFITKCYDNNTGKECTKDDKDYYIFTTKLDMSHIFNIKIYDRVMDFNTIDDTVCIPINVKNCDYTPTYYTPYEGSYAEDGCHVKTLELKEQNYDLTCDYPLDINTSSVMDSKFSLIKKGNNYYYQIINDGNTIGQRQFYKNGEFIPTIIDTTYVTSNGSQEKSSFTLSNEKTGKIYKDAMESGECPHESLVQVNWNPVNSQGTDFQISDTVSDKYSAQYNLDKYFRAAKNPLKALDRQIMTYEFTTKGKKVTFDQIEGSDDICSLSECAQNPKEYAERAIKDIMNYCNTKIYRKGDIKNPSLGDCVSFYQFYNNLVNDKVVENYIDDCGILSNDLKEKLNFVLDIIKIAGPLAALGLGTLDFVKAIASGDADKEMKTAWKRFTTRLIAAVLLFIVPIVLAFLMDMFLGNQDGYNADNPFCGMVDWEELK